MADTEHKINPRAQRAGLRRLSERANAFPDRLPHPVSASCSTSTSSSSSTTSSSSAPLSLPQFAKQLADHLRSCDVPLARGLSQPEFERIEAIHGFVFPPDLHALLSHSVPTAPGFPDWRSPSSSALAHWLNIPVSTVCSAVRDNGFWCSKHWGSKLVPRGIPSDVAVQSARHKLRIAPVLVPVFGFFFMPASPSRAGNPLFMVQDGAVVCCGGGLGEFFRRGFLTRMCEELQFDQGEEPAENRRWSTSTVIERVQFQDRIEQGGRTRSLPSGRRDSVIIEDEDEPSEFESWGRNLDALARCSLEALKRRRRRSGSISERRRSSFSGTGIQEQYTLSSSLTKLVMDNLLRFSDSTSNNKPRRIEFWSDAAEKMLKDHRKQPPDSDNDPFRFSMCLSRSSVSDQTEATCPMASDPSQTPEQDSSSKEEDTPWISGLLEEVAARLRNAGWREDDISEMVDGSSPKSVLFPNNNNPEDCADPELQQVIKSRLSNVPYFFGLSMSLKRAGFSSQEVSDVLCFDPSKRSCAISRVE